MTKRLSLIEQLHARVTKLEQDISCQEEQYSKGLSEENTGMDIEIFTKHSVDFFIEKLLELKTAKEAIKTYYKLQEESNH